MSAQRSAAFGTFDAAQPSSSQYNHYLTSSQAPPSYRSPVDAMNRLSKSPDCEDIIDDYASMDSEMENHSLPPQLHIQPPTLNSTSYPPYPQTASSLHTSGPALSSTAPRQLQQPPWPPSPTPTVTNPHYEFNDKVSFEASQNGLSDLESRTHETDEQALTSINRSATTRAHEGREKQGFWKSVLPDSIACRLYVLTVVIETAVDITIEADLFRRVQAVTNNQDLSTARLPVYLSIFVLAHVFQLIMAIDAVHARNTLQFIFLTIFNALFLIYSVIQITEIRQSIPSGTTGISDIPVQVLTTIIPIVISVAEVAYIALGWRIYSEFGWKVYKFLGADRTIKRIYAHYQIFLCLMKFDVFFFVAFSAQLVLLVLSKNWEVYLTIAAIPGSLILLILGFWAARYEKKYPMAVFIVGCVGAMVYFVYKLIEIIRFTGEKQKVQKTLAVFAIISIVSIIGTFGMAIRVLLNFDYGLKKQLGKQSIFKRNRNKANSTSNRASYPMSANPKRMSID